MSFEAKVIILIIAIFVFVLACALCMVAGTSDEQAQELFRDYLKSKRRKERRDNGIDEEED